MHLMKLEMKGFKSFSQRAEMQFDKGVTAVVGPNGCGKSNIADAIRWVLGEQSARSLRGQKMEDVIFSGTDRKKAQGLAEVTIVFDNGCQSLPLPYKEVAITRRVYRSGESEYLINRNRCRLKDVRELLMDTGIGKEGYSIIGQGRIDELLNQRGDDRRLLFDEAAGIVKYRTRKEEAQKRMNQTEENLSRLQDILLELEEQLEPLRKQAAKAEKYLNLREKVSILEIDGMIREHGKLRKTMEQLEEEKSAREEFLKQLTQNQNGLHRQERDLSGEIELCQEKMAEMDQEIRAIEGQLEEIKTQIRLKEQALDHIKEQKNRLKESVAAIRSEIDTERHQRQMLQDRLAEHQILLQEKNEKYGVLQERIQVEDLQLKKRRERLEDNKAGIIETLNEISGFKAKRERIQALQDAASERDQQIIADMDQIQGIADHLAAERQRMISQLESITRRITQLKEEEESQRKLVERKKIEQEALDKEIREINQEFDKCSHRKNVLVNMERSFEGFQRGVKSVLKAAQQNSRISNGFHGVVADLLRVPKGYEVAVETALGPALQYLVTEDESQAKTIIEFLKANHQGRVTLLPMAVIRERLLRNQEMQVLEKYPNASCALDIVSFPSPYRSVFGNLLGRVVIADTLETAISMARDLRHQIKITTLEGDLIQAGGSMTGGSVSSQQDGLLVRKREIEELGNQMHELASKRLHMNDMKSRLEEKIDSLKKRLMDIQQEHGIESQRAVRLESEEQGLQHQVTERQHQLKRLESELHQLSNHRNELDSDLKMIESALGLKEQALEDVRADIENEVANLQLMQQQLDELSAQLQRQQIELAEYNEKNKALTAEEEALSLRLQGSEQKHAGMVIEADQLVDRVKTIEMEMEQLTVQSVQINEQLQERKEKEKELNLLARKKREELTGVQNEGEANKTRQEEAKENIYQAELRRSRQEWQLQQIEDKLEEQHQLNPTQARIWLQGKEGHGLKSAELNGFKREMLSLGDVHVGALDEYHRVKERYDFLIRQRQDLVEARESLKQIISELETHMIQQFQEQFERIQLRFQEVFRRLFNGGHTELVLQNPEDLLTTGIDIVAQPPGKKSQHLSLLSGGEKALTAIALLFGILLVKPSPFCVLDEIEAALDDANVSRFADYLVNLSTEIQFVVVTHKKQTMERAQTLYGITMQEKGISKLLTLKLQEIDQNMIAG